MGQGRDRRRPMAPDPVAVGIEAPVRALQGDIDTWLPRLGGADVKGIVLGAGSEMSNLHMNAEVDVFVGDEPERRPFTIVTPECVAHFIREVEGKPRPDLIDIYTVGGPLVVVARINGSSIVRGVVRYLALEGARGTRPGQRR
jgi:hypothetical protein